MVVSHSLRGEADFFEGNRGGGPIYPRSGKETPFLRHFILKIDILPRQARDKHRENSKKNGVLL
jgi:hypothetical protein